MLFSISKQHCRSKTLQVVDDTRGGFHRKILHFKNFQISNSVHFLNFVNILFQLLTYQQGNRSVREQAVKDDSQVSTAQRQTQSEQSQPDKTDSKPAVKNATTSTLNTQANQCMTTCCFSKKLNALKIMISNINIITRE